MHGDINNNKTRHSRESGNPEQLWIPGQARNDKLDNTYIIIFRFYRSIPLWIKRQNGGQ